MKIAFLFPGQNGHYNGLSIALYEKYPVIQEYFAKASEHTGINFEKILEQSHAEVCEPAPFGEFCFPSEVPTRESFMNRCLAQYIESCSLAHILKEQHVKASWVAGYDSGLYAALQTTDSCSFVEGLNIIKKYAEFYSDLLNKEQYEFIQLNGLTATELPHYLNKQTTVAVYQARTQHIVGGTREGVALMRDKLQNAARTLVSTAGIVGLHSDAMSIVADQLKLLLDHITFKDLRMPLVSSMSGTYLDKGSQVQEEILKEITHPLHWDKVMDSLQDADLFIGLGCNTATDLVSEKYTQKASLDLCTLDDLEKLHGLMRK